MTATAAESVADPLAEPLSQPQQFGSQPQFAGATDAMQKAWQPQVFSPWHHGDITPDGRELQYLGRFIGS